MGFNRLSDIFKLAKEAYPALSKRLKEADALSRFEIAVGPIIAKHARAIRVQNQVLWVEVDHPIWKTELHYRKRQILDTLNTGVSANPSAKPMAPAQEVIKDILLLEPRTGSPRP